MHILAITSTGGVIIGNRPLDLDGIEPHLAYHDGLITRGFTTVRAWTPEDGQQIPSIDWWGYDVIRQRANRLFAVAGA